MKAMIQLKRLVSLVLIVTFTYEQALFAGDLSYGLPVGNEKNNSGFMTAEQLADAQARQEEMIRRLETCLESKLGGDEADSEWTLQEKTGGAQTLEGGETATSAGTLGEAAGGAIVNVMTAAGDRISYEDGLMKRVERADGTVLEGIEYDAAGALLSAVIHTPDGGVMTVEGGVTRSYLGPDGVAVHYDANGRIEWAVAADGLVSYYAYQMNAAGEIVKTTVTNPDRVMEYGSDRTLNRLTKSDGTAIEYDRGIIALMTLPDGSRYFFGSVAKDGTLEVKVKECLTKEGYRLVFDESASIVVITSPAGETTTFDADGTPVSSGIELSLTYDARGRVSQALRGMHRYVFSYTEDAAGNTVSTRVTEESGAAALYDASGSLVNVTGATSVVDEAAMEAMRSSIAKIAADLAIASNVRVEAERSAAPVKAALYNAAAAKDAARAVYDEAVATLNDAAAARRAAEDALYADANGFRAVDYATIANGMSVSLRRITVNDPFNAFDAGAWTKSLVGVSVAAGELLLSGLGATVLARDSVPRIDEPVVTFDFKVDGATAQFCGGIDNGRASLSSSARMALGVAVENGAIRINANTGSGEMYYPTPIVAAKANTYYSCRIEVKNDSAAISVWEKGTTQPGTPVYTLAGGGWDVVARFKTGAGRAWVDNARVEYTVPVVKTYDTLGRIVTFTQEDHSSSTYVYDGSGASLQTDSDPFDMQAGGWSMPSSNYYSYANGALTVKGSATGLIEYKISSSPSQPRTELPVYSVDFSPSSTNFAIKVTGIASTGRRELQIVPSGASFAIKTLAGTTLATVVPSAGALAQGTAYTAQFAVTATGIEVYVWQKGTPKPASPAYVWNEAGWSTNFVAACKAGSVALDNYSVTRKVAALAVDPLVTGLMQKISAEATAAGAVDAASAPYQAAQSAYDAAAADHAPYKAALDAALGKEAGLVSAKTGAEAGLKEAEKLYNSFAPELAWYRVADWGGAYDRAALSAAVSESVGFSKLVYAAADRTVRRVVKPDGATVAYNDGFLDRVSENGVDTFYGYAFSPLGTVSEVTVDREGVKRIYDRYGNLSAITTDGVTKITYANGKVQEIVRGDGTSLKNLTFRDSGELSGALISYPDGSVALYGDGELLSLISTAGDAVDCADGKIRKVTAADGTVYEWSYEGENIAIHDSVKNERRIYRDGQLLVVESLSGARLTTRYLYDDLSRLVKSEVCSGNDVLYVYTYTYEDGLTVIHDQDGNIQAYTPDKKLSYLIDSKGRKFAYTYVGKDGGANEAYFPDGTKARYASDGSIIDLVLSDGSHIVDLVFDGNGSPLSYTCEKEGVTYTFEDGRVTKKKTAEGDTYFYDETGLVSAVDRADGTAEVYDYAIRDTRSFADEAAFVSGVLDNISLGTKSDTTYLELQRTPIDLGDGSDGDFVSNGNVYLSGTKNYKSFYLRPGDTLYATDTLVLKSLGNVRIEGTVSADGYGYASGYGCGASGGAVNSRTGGGGGGFVTPGIRGQGTTGGAGGAAYGDDSLRPLYKGSAGGNGSPVYSWGTYYYYRGGAGGGAVMVSGKTVDIEGAVTANGSAGAYDAGFPTNSGGGGGSGGSIFIRGEDVIVNGNLSAMGGKGGGLGGKGSDGRIRIDYAETMNGTVPLAAKQYQIPYYASGTFTSAVVEVDAKSFGSLSWTETLPAGTGVSLQTRTGDTDSPDTTWSAWSSPVTDPSGSAITSSPARYLQYRVTFTTSDQYATPVVVSSILNPIAFDYERRPHSASDLSALAHVEILSNGITRSYGSSGALLWTKDASGNVSAAGAGSSAAVDISSLAAETAGFTRLNGELPAYVLNDSQKSLYLKGDVIIAELVSIRNADGTAVEYKQGQVRKIVAPDGTVIGGISLDESGGIADFTYTRAGKSVEVRDEAVYRVTENGTTTEYYGNGFVRSIGSGAEIRSFTYGVDAAVALDEAALIESSGSTIGATVRNDGRAAFLELRNDLVDYGTGADGDLRVEAGQTVTIDGTKNYRSIYVAPGATLNVVSWNGATGGTLVLKAQGPIVIEGTVTVSAAGYRGGDSIGGQGAYGEAGESPSGIGGASSGANGGGGGGGGNGVANARVGSSAGGGGYGTAGSSGGSNATNVGGSGGAPYGDEALASFLMGSGGGKGGAWWGGIDPAAGNGGRGGGALKITGSDITINGIVTAEGESGQYGGGGGGSGGAIWIAGDNVAVNGTISVAGGKGGTGCAEGSFAGGNGGQGRLRIDYGTLSGNVPDSAYTQEIIYSSSGTFDSQPVELDAFSLGTIAWSEEVLEGTSVSIQTRTGNIAAPDATWSAWSDPVAGAAGSTISSPAARYLQYRVTLSSGDGSATPRFFANDTHAIDISYVRWARGTLDPYVKVKEAGILSAYNGAGVLIWREDSSGVRTAYDPLDRAGTIDIASLSIDGREADARADVIEDARLNDAQKVVTVYDRGNDLPVAVVSAGGTAAYFDEGFATKVVDRNGTVQILYTYDADKNVVRAEFVDARAKLEASVEKAKTGIITQKESGLADITRKADTARASVAHQSALLLAQVARERERLAAERAKYDANIYDLSEFDRAFEELDMYAARIEAQEGAAYADIDAQVASAREGIEADAATAMAGLIENEYHRALADIAEKESVPVIYHYYRLILGRDPGEDELAYWTAAAKMAMAPLGAQRITAELKALPEYTDRAARKSRIIESVRSFLTGYANATGEGRAEIAAALGLAGGEAVALTQDDVSAIIGYLEAQSLHFGDSAIESVRAMLKAEGITASFEQVAREALKIDILTGVINRETGGDLVISLYAMRKTAAAYGAHFTSVKIDYAELKDQASRASVTVHIDGKHYVVVTGIDDEKGTVTYIDPTVGTSGQKMSVTRAQFMEAWRGYALSKELPSDTAKVVNATVEKNIRGSGWWKDFWKGIVSFFGKIVAPVAVLLIVTGNPIGFALLGFNVLIQTVAYVTRTGTLMDLVWSVVACEAVAIIGTVVNLASSSIQSVASSLQPALKGVFQPVVELFKPIYNVAHGITTSIGTIFNLTGTAANVAAQISTFVIGQAVNLGSNMLLRSLNIDPTLADIGSAIFSGAFLGGLSATSVDGIAVGLMRGALQSGIIAGVETLGVAAKLDPSIVHLAAMTSGAIVGGLFTTPTGKTFTSSELMKDLQGTIAGEAAYIGIQRLGEVMGIDPRISYLAGVGIRSSIDVGLTRGFKPDVIWGSVQSGLLRGVTSVALEWGAESLGLSPLIGSLTSAAIAGGLEALLMGQNPVQGIFDTYFRAGTGLLTLGGDGGNNPWLRAAYLSQVLDFSRIVQERGIVNALETYSAGFLHQQTINEIWKQGGIADLLTKPNQIEITTNRKGETVKRIYTMDINSASDKLISNYIDLSPTYDMLMGFREGNVITHCEFVVGPDGKPQLKNGEREIFNPDGSERIEYVENFNLNKMDYIDKYGTKVGYYVPATGVSSVIVGSDGKVTSGKFVSLITDYSVSTKDNQVTDLSFKRDYTFSETQRANLLNAGYAEQDLSGFKEIVSIANGVLQYFVLPSDTSIFNINEAEGRAWLDSIEADGRAFWQGTYDLFRDAVAGDPLPQFSSDSTYPYANIELNLVLPGRSEGIIAGLDLLNVVTGDITSPLNSFATQNSTWNHNTDYSAQLYAASFDMGYKFVFGGGAKFLLSGEGSNRLDLGNLNTFYSSLNTTNTIGIGFSADTVSIAKSWLVSNTAKADHYFLFSPQLSPKELEGYMRIGGISPDMITIVETSGDFPRQWLGGFSNNLDSNKVKKWDYIKIVSGPSVSLLNPFSSHGVPVRGVLDGGQYIVEVNGIRSADPVSLADIYSYYANRSS